MKFGLFTYNFNEHADANLLLNFGIEAEKAGWDGVFLADHLHYKNTIKLISPWIILSGIATRTETIKLGTWVTAVPRRLPWQLAQDLATLDHLSNGRVILGAGLGAPPEDYSDYGTEYDLKQLAKRFDESLDIINGLWGHENFSYEGDVFKINNVNLFPKPVQQPRIPILIAGRWPAKNPIKRGARWDGIMPISKDFPQQIPVDEIQNCIDFFHTSRTSDSPGEVVLIYTKDSPRIEEFLPLCESMGVTWMLFATHPDMNSTQDPLEYIKQGPPKTS